jgi:iron(III) transport system substrate-binding protein
MRTDNHRFLGLLRDLLPITTCTLLLSITGCWQSSPDRVVVYTALDREFSAPLLESFSQTSGLTVDPKFDVESTKTVGLTQAILAEAKRPRCDVFWNNEILNTIRLQKQGRLLPYVSTAGAAYPEAYRDPQGYWYGFAARARVLIVNTQRVDEASYPTSIHDLVDEKWQGRIGLAKPLFGTTATHATVLFHLWGTERATQFFQAAKNNAQIMAGNKQVALAVASGQLDWGITDTDDANVERLKGSPVAIIYPDQADGEMGTLFIPNTVAIIANSPHPAAAKQLVEWVLSSEVEATLSAGPSAQIPLRPDVPATAQVKTPGEIRPLSVDFGAAADSWDEAAPVLRDLFFRVGP